MGQSTSQANDKQIACPPFFSSFTDQNETSIQNLDFKSAYQLVAQLEAVSLTAKLILTDNGGQTILVQGRIDAKLVKRLLANI